jgi:alanyl-tRNA synthetase
LETLEEIKATFKHPTNVVKAIKDLIQQKAQLEKELKGFKKDKTGNLKEELLNEAIEINGVSFVGKKVDLDPKSVKNLAFQLRGTSNKLFIILGSDHGGKPTITIALSDSLVDNKDLNAGTIVRELAKDINGGGGGQAHFATAGGGNSAGIESAIEKAKNYLQ